MLRCCPQSCGIAGFPETENQGCGKAGGAMVGGSLDVRSPAAVLSLFRSMVTLILR